MINNELFFSRIHNPEQQQYIRQERERALVQLWERGIETADCVAYHGTSINVIDLVIENGVIPGKIDPRCSDYRPVLPQEGDLYFAPRLDTFPFDSMPQEMNLLSEGRIDVSAGEFALGEAQWYAEHNANAHMLCEQLDIDVGYFQNTVLNIFDDPDAIKLDAQIGYNKLDEAGLTRNQIREAVNVVRSSARKGVIIGLRNTALSLYSPVEGDSGNDFRLQTAPFGLAYRHISGILPLGEYEKEFFQTLKEKHTV